MKLFSLLLVGSQAQSGIQRKTCFTCDAENHAKCRDTGSPKTCWQNQDSCFVQERKRNGVTYKVLCSFFLKLTHERLFNSRILVARRQKLWF